MRRSEKGWLALEFCQVCSSRALPISISELPGPSMTRALNERPNSSSRQPPEPGAEPQSNPVSVQLY